MNEDSGISVAAIPIFLFYIYIVHNIKFVEKNMAINGGVVSIDKLQ